MRVDGSRRAPNPGLRRQQVTVERKVASGTGTLGTEYSWQTWKTVYVAIAPLQGREMEAVHQTLADARYRVELPKLAGLKHDMRLNWWDGSATRYLEILNIQEPLGVPLQQVLYCREWAE